jgi:hypothetical protein
LGCFALSEQCCFIIMLERPGGDVNECELLIDVLGTGCEPNVDKEPSTYRYRKKPLAGVGWEANVGRERDMILERVHRISC